MIYRKLYMDKIIPFIDTPFIKILTGIRRSGKSTILAMIRDELRKRGIKAEQILSYRFDSPLYEDITTARDLYNEIKNHLYPDGRTYIFLDEIQEITGWEKAVNSFLQDFNADIYVTGSNSRMLSSEISTYLTGRYVSFRIYPLTFAEYLDFRTSYTAPGDPHQEFARYIRYGGFPALHLRDYTPEEAYTVVYDIYNSTIFTDIVKRNQIRKVDQLERIVKYVFDNVGQTFSASSISRYMKRRRGIYYGLDLLRIICTIAVVNFHAAPEQLPGGYLAVCVFFVMHGYLFVLSAARKHEFSVKEYWKTVSPPVRYAAVIRQTPA